MAYIHLTSLVLTGLINKELSFFIFQVTYHQSHKSTHILHLKKKKEKNEIVLKNRVKLMKLMNLLKSSWEIFAPI